LKLLLHYAGMKTNSSRIEQLVSVETVFYNTTFIYQNNKVSPMGRRDDMPLVDGSSTVAKIAADLLVRTSLMAGGG